MFLPLNNNISHLGMYIVRWRWGSPNWHWGVDKCGNYQQDCQRGWHCKCRWIRRCSDSTFYFTRWRRPAKWRRACHGSESYSSASCRLWESNRSACHHREFPWSAGHCWGELHRGTKRKQCWAQQWVCIKRWSFCRHIWFFTFFIKL